MRRTLLLAALFVALGATTSSAQYSNRDRVERRVTQPGVYQDERGDYQWQTVERRVWIPERRTSGVFGIGSRTIPGHYEMRTERIKVYRNANRNNQYGNQRRGWEGKHPHGMPPGQRKKLESRRYDDRYDRNDRNDRDDRYDHNDRYDSKSKGKKNKGGHGRDND
ncbi:hypothetical protein GZH53_02080 [Flavihumibacter sp. R14]|nr:hypothetical protein [Flavihumibacter soli]